MVALLKPLLALLALDACASFSPHRRTPPRARPLRAALIPVTAVSRGGFVLGVEDVCGVTAVPVVRQGAALRRLHRAEAMRAPVEAAVSCRSERASEAAVSFRNAPEAVMQPEKSTLATRGIQSCVRSRESGRCRGAARNETQAV